MTEAAPSVEHAEPTLRLRGVGRRFGGLLAVHDVDLDVVARASVARSSARTARGRRRSSTSSAETCPRRPARSSSSARTSRRSRPATGRSSGLARTYQQSRLFNGLTVEDCDLPRRSSASTAGACVRSLLPAANVRSASGRAMRPGRSRSRDKLGELVGSLSHGEHRQVAIAMALAAEPKALMLDEPASGLSRGERAAPHRAPARARSGHHADPHRARHGHRAHASPSR